MGGNVDLSLPAAHDEFMITIDMLQRTLRAALRTAIAEPAFAAVFADDEQILARWPVTIIPKDGRAFTV